MSMKAPTAKVLRDATLFVAGLAGIAYETLAQGGERPTLLILFAAMVGLPAFLRSDERTKTPDPAAPPQAAPASQEVTR